MSYPRKLHILVVEDDADAINACKNSFEIFAKNFSLIEPVYVRSHDEAKGFIDGTDLFHVVILDLNLPLAKRGQTAEGLVPGEQLLEDLAKRDSYPIPVVLIVSGKLNLAQPIGGLQDRLTNDFWYGRLVNKGPGQAAEIEAGLAQALKYVDVGVHLRDGGGEWFPTLSPREEDLLRRCVLSQSSSLGVDVRWWSAEPGASVSQPSPNRGPTKVLMGHFLMDDGMGRSIPAFFKFQPAGDGPFDCRDTGILAQKLPHVKILHTANARQRSLIATQNVTNWGVPISLNEYLHGNPAVVVQNIPKLIKQAVDQLSLLGNKRENEVPVSGFLWKYLDRAAIERAWNRCDCRQLVEDGYPNPLATFDSITASTVKHWTNWTSCTHGDLNATNVAIDSSTPQGPQTYIFDAAGMKQDLEFRDLATLEVTTILFNSVGNNEIAQACGAFYTNDLLPKEAPGLTSASSFAQNVFAMIAAIRSHLHPDQDKIAYALLIFDAALRQLSGLGIQPSPNKVRNPFHACCIAAWSAKWIESIAPRLVTPAPPGNTNTIN